MRWLILGALVVSVAFGAPAVFANHDDVGPAYKHSTQKAVCMIFCGSGECEFDLVIRDEYGDTLIEQRFTDVGYGESRKIVYAGAKNLISCQTRRDDGRTLDPSLAILDATWKTVAIMTNDRSDNDCDECAESTACR